jgi:hypothetical protein
VSGQLLDRAVLTPAKEPSILIEDEVSSTPRLFGGRENSVGFAGSQIAISVPPSPLRTLSGLLED